MTKDMNRRDALKAGAAAAALPAVLEAQDSSAWKPSVLTAHQNTTVIAISDRIIPATDTPGAKEAQVNRYIDLILRDGPERERKRFLAGLEWLDGYSKKLHKETFAGLKPDQQTRILERLEAAESADLKQGHEFFRMAKAMTARIYYLTEIGFKELNKGGVPSGFGCDHKEHAGSSAE